MNICNDACPKSYNFALKVILYLHVWNRIRIRNADPDPRGSLKHRSNTDPDPQHGLE